MIDTRPWMHWHKPNPETPSALLDLTPGEVLAQCCLDALYAAETKVADRERSIAEGQVREERRRLVRHAVAELDGYSQGFETVLNGERLELVERVVELCRSTVRKVGCICPLIDVTTLGESPGSRTLPGFDPLCGVHDSTEARAEARRKARE